MSPSISPDHIVRGSTQPCFTPNGSHMLVQYAGSLYSTESFEVVLALGDQIHVSFIIMTVCGADCELPSHFDGESAPRCASIIMPTSSHIVWCGNTIDSLHQIADRVPFPSQPPPCEWTYNLPCLGSMRCERGARYWPESHGQNAITCTLGLSSLTTVTHSPGTQRVSCA